MTGSSERMSDRRTFLTSSTGGLLAAALAAASVAMPRIAAGQEGKRWRIGVLTEGANTLRDLDVPGIHFVNGLRDLGYVEGQNVVIEYRYADNQPERIPVFAAELVRLKVDVLATSGTRETIAAKAATSAIPIVMLFVGDPVGVGLVSSLTHPGANITGTSLMYSDVSGKRLELLREIVPTLRHVAILGNRRNISTDGDMRAAETAARSVKLDVYSVEVDSPSRLDAAFDDMTRVRPDGVLVCGDALTFSHRREIAAAALRAGIATFFAASDYVKSGGLVSYGPDLRALAGRAASYVDKI